MKAALYTMPKGRLTTRASVPEFKDLAGGNSPTKFIAQIPLTVPAFLECHVTPADVAEEMARALPDMAGKHVLEPSAGTGSLLDAMKRVHPEAIVQGVEIYRPLQERLIQKGYEVYCDDFAEWAKHQGATRDAVIMNPPFRKVKEHIIAAFGLLKRGGVMVALVPVTFRDGEIYMNLDADTFSAAKVHTKVIKMVKGY
jgi:hypothetical protein